MIQKGKIVRNEKVFMRCHYLSPWFRWINCVVKNNDWQYNKIWIKLQVQYDRGLSRMLSVRKIMNLKHVGMDNEMQNSKYRII